MDSDDEEAPPLLVHVEGQENSEEKGKDVKVPITIVTGTPPIHSLGKAETMYLTCEFKDTLELGRRHC